MVFASLSFLIAFGVSLQAKPVQFKGVEYTLPAGWKAAQNGDAQILSPSGMPANKLLAVMIIPAIPKSDKSWKETFQAFLDAATKTVTVVSKSEIQSTTRAPYELFVQVQKQKSKDLGEYDCLYQMVATDQSAAATAVLTNDDQLTAKYRDDITAIMRSSHPMPVSKPIASTTKIRTGETPRMYPGSNGWLPSGKGTPIPRAHLQNGKPIGMWMNAGFDSSQKSAIFSTIFLADGTMVQNPRFGGGNLIDIAGQVSNPNDVKSVGKWSISGGKLTIDINGGHDSQKFTTGKDENGEFFMFGVAKYSPCAPVTPEFLAGSWRVPGSTQYDFAKDGTAKYGYAFQGSNSAVGGGNATGRWILDGYLVAVDLPNSYIVNEIFRYTKDAIVIGQRIYFRVK